MVWMLRGERDTERRAMREGKDSPAWRRFPDSGAFHPAHDIARPKVDLALTDRVFAAWRKGGLHYWR